MPQLTIDELVTKMVGDTASYERSMMSAAAATERSAIKIIDSIKKSEKSFEGCDTAAKTFNRTAAILKTGLDQGAMSQGVFNRAMQQAKEDLSEAEKGVGKLHLSIRDIRHAIHVMSSMGIMPHTATRGIMQAYYMFHMLNPMIGTVINSFKTLRGAMIATGVGAVVAGLAVAMSYISMLAERHTEAAKVASHAFVQMVTGAKTYAEAINDVKVESLTSGLKKTTKYMTDPGMFETGGALGMGSGLYQQHPELRGIDMEVAARKMLTRTIEDELDALKMVDKLMKEPDLRAKGLQVAEAKTENEIIKTTLGLEDQIDVLERTAYSAKNYGMALKRARAEGIPILDFLAKYKGELKELTKLEIGADRVKMSEGLFKEGIKADLIGMGKIEAAIEEIVRSKAHEYRMTEDDIREVYEFELAEKRRLMEKTAVDTATQSLREKVADMDRYRGMNKDEQERVKLAESLGKELAKNKNITEAELAAAQRKIAVDLKGLEIAQQRAHLQGLVDKTKGMADEARRSGLGDFEAERLKLIQDTGRAIKNNDETRAQSEARAATILAPAIGNFTRLQEIKATQGATEATRQQGREIDKLVVSLYQGASAAERYGMAQELAKKMGDKAGDIEKAKQLIGLQLEYHRLGQLVKGNVEIGKQANELEDQAARVGMLTDAAHRFTMVQKFARENNLSWAESSRILAFELNRVKEAQGTIAAQKMWEEVMRPQEKYEKRMEEINDLWRNGKISAEIYGRAAEKAFGEMNGKAEKLTGTLYNSAEGMSHIYDYLQMINHVTLSSPPGLLPGKTAPNTPPVVVLTQPDSALLKGEKDPWKANIIDKMREMLIELKAIAKKEGAEVDPEDVPN